MKLEGKKISFLGDSITYGVGASSVEARFTKIIEREEKLGTMRNYGISGTRIARQHHVPSANPAWDQDFCSRVADMDPDADVVVVFGGTNDYGHGDAPLGTPDDRTPDTFWGACHTLMRTLIEKYPTAVIVIMTPIHRANDTHKNHAGVGLAGYVDILKETARFYGLPVLDLFAMGGIQPSIEAQKIAFCPDGLHPNDAGNRRIADRLIAFLRAY